MIGLDNVSLDVILPTFEEKVQVRKEMKECETEDIIRVLWDYDKTENEKQVPTRSRIL